MAWDENMTNEISRVTRSKQEARASYDRMSRWYDILSGRFEKRYRDEGLGKLGAREGEVVLEVGFGTGRCILALAQAVGDKGKVYGIDISEGMCNISLSRMEKSGLSEMVELHCGDATQLPFKSNCFDVVFISFALELFDTPEIPLILDECRRVLRSDGRICIVAMSKKGEDGIMVKLYEWFHDRLPNYVDCRPIYVRDALEQAGFRVQDVSKMSMWGLPVEIVLARK
jgi:demethylmenaquinone methyltransferase/2-methoxy-6-polyprenyl-1,4-benzoquinol methylase